MASPTTAQEEAKSPEPPAKPSHGRHENGAEERAGYRETDHRGVAATHTIPQEVHGHDERSTNHDINGGEQNQR
jgi:hypothetical protein